MAESKQEAGVIYTGSDDGLVHITRDGGKNWANITPPMSPKNNMINCIDVDPHHLLLFYSSRFTLVQRSSPDFIPVRSAKSFQG